MRLEKFGCTLININNCRTGLREAAIKISSLQIRNFRGISEGFVQFSGHTAFIGPNNCGKSSIVAALALLLGRDRLVPNLTEHDFYGGNPGPQDRIVLIATISDFPANDPEQNPDWFRVNRAIPQWYSPLDHTTSPKPTASHTQLCAQISFHACFNATTLSVETERIFFDGKDVDPFLDDSAIRVPNSLIATMGFFLVSASRTWDRMVSFNSELFRRVISTLSSVPANAIVAERDRLRAPEPPIEADSKLTDLVERVNAEMGTLFVESPRLQFRVTSTDSDSLLRSIVPHFQFDGGPALPAGRHGTGLISVQSLLLLLEFGRLRRKSGADFLLAFEEPELHVPPGLQRRLVHRIQSVSSQSIVTSHAPLTAAYYEGTNVRVVQNNRGNLVASPLLQSSLKADATNPVRKLFIDERRDTIASLMSEIVLIPEGRFDCEWLNRLVACTETQESMEANEELDVVPFGTSVGVIRTQDARIAETFKELSRLHPRIAVLVDGDSDGSRYKKELLSGAVVPFTILQWPTGWTIEDVVAWILAADNRAIGEVANSSQLSLKNEAEFLVHAKLAARNGGFKDDVVVHENICRVITSYPLCLFRAQRLLTRLASALVSPKEPCVGFSVEPLSERCTVRIFDPLCSDLSKVQQVQAKRTASAN